MSIKANSKSGFKKLVDRKVQRYKFQECGHYFTTQEKFHHLSQGKIELIHKMYEEKGEQRKITRILGISLKAVQHHLKKKMKQTIEFYQESIQEIRDSLSFEYSVMDELFELELDLPKVQRVYSDDAFAYNTMYAEKSIQGKGAMTNKIENLNSQLRDKISYLVRKTKAHAKSAEWLDYRLAIFFNAKNLRLYG